MKNLLPEWMSIGEDTATITWHVDDVQMYIPRLTRDQAREVLHETIRKHNAEHGVSWDIFEVYANMMFPVGDVE